MKTITKRNGKVEEFDFSKIENAVKAAFASVDTKFTDDNTIPIVLKVIKNTIEVKEPTTVEDIQNIVEDSLMCCGHYEVAKSYILYREKHSESRFIQSRLDYMDKYSNSNVNAATASETDSNANVAMKNVANMEGEVYKTQNRLVQRTRMKKRLKEMYPEVADQYEVDLNNHIIYVHDEASSPAVKNYTYSPDEVINFKYNDTECLGSLKTLYDLAIETEVQQEENGVWCKFPQSLYVKDKDEKYTKVTRLTRKTRYNDMVRVKTAFGEDLIVTANHPLIVSDDKEDKVNAENAIGLSQLRLPCTLKFKGIKIIDLASCVNYDEVHNSYILTHETQAPYYFTKRYIELDRTLGYVIGFFVGDGNYDNTYNTLMFSQKDKKVLEKLADSLFKSFGTVSYIHQNNNGVYVLKLCSSIVYDLFRNYFKIKDKAYNKCIPYNVLEFTEDFAKGIIEGIIDSDGTVDTNSAISIRLSSRECIMQLSVLLRYFGYGVSNTHQATPFGNNRAFKTNYDIWGIYFTNIKNAVKFDGAVKWKNITREVQKGIKYSAGWTSITSVEKLSSSTFLDERCQFIYDITTESNTFECNNLWVHNCMAATLYPMMLEGTGNIDGVTPCAPNDIQSFSGQVTNLVFLLSSQVKGAVALGDYFVALNYYVIAEFGPKWYEHLNDRTTSEACKNQRTVKDAIRKGMKQFIYGVSQPAGNRSYNSPFSNLNFFDSQYFASLFEDFYYPDGTKPEWKAIDVLQRIFLELHRELRLIKPLTFPVTTMCLLHNNNDIVDKEYKELCAEELSKGSSFFIYLSDSSNSVSSCCRVQNKITENTFSSTTGLTGIMTGSSQVITLNFNRIVQNWYKTQSCDKQSIDWSNSENIYRKSLQEYLIDILKRVYKYQIAYKSLVYDAEDRGMYSSSNAGYIYTKKLYSTIGFIGYCEAAEFMGLSVNYNKQYISFVQTLLKTIEDQNKIHSIHDKKRPCVFNSEGIPGEDLAVKLYNWDKEDGYIVPDDQNLYSSYFFKQWDPNISILDKLRLHGKEIASYCSGGYLLATYL